VGVLDDEIISHVVILHRPAWAGRRTIDVAGITAVATHPYYQRRGFGTRVMRDALAVARRRNYDLAILTTQVPDHFRRFGFVETPAVNSDTGAAMACAPTAGRASRRLNCEQHGHHRRHYREQRQPDGDTGAARASES
jgi:putative acetyltransferase